MPPRLIQVPVGRNLSSLERLRPSSSEVWPLGSERQLDGNRLGLRTPGRWESFEPSTSLESLEDPAGFLEQGTSLRRPLVCRKPFAVFQQGNGEPERYADIAEGTFRGLERRLDASPVVI